MARRVHSLHHNLGSANVVFHREHRSKKGRQKNYATRKRLAGFVAERRDRIVERRNKKSMRDFVKGIGRLNMTA